MLASGIYWGLNARKFISIRSDLAFLLYDV